MDKLREFYADIHMRSSVKDYLDSFTAQEGVTMIFERKDVSHIADAKELIDKAFNHLDVMYEQRPAEPAITNNAR